MSKSEDLESDLVATVALVFLCPALAMWAWNYGAADSLHLPRLAYWPVFWTRLALRMLVR